MKRRRRTKILIEGNPELAREFATEMMEAYEWKEIIAPRNGLTMIKMRESAKNSLFYLGEVLVTEAKVEINENIGIGLVTGMNEQLALDLAIIDASYNANLPETKNWYDALVEEEKKITREKASEQAKLFDTKVDFQTMQTDD